MIRIMPTTIHLTPDLLAAVDQRARDLELTRNRFISESLRRTLENDERWSPALVSDLRSAGASPEERRALTELRRSLRPGTHER